MTPAAWSAKKISISANHTTTIMQNEKINANLNTDSSPKRRTTTRVRRLPDGFVRAGLRPARDVGVVGSSTSIVGSVVGCSVVGSSAVVVILVPEKF
jgi:hypothetical protein